MLARLRAFLRTRTGRLVLHDGALALATGYAAWEAGGHSVTWAAVTAALVVAGKAFLRLILPVPASPASPALSSYRPRVDLLPSRSTQPKTGRRPKPVDARDLPLARYLTADALPTPPARVNWASAVAAFGMLLNNRIGDCGEAGWLHALQVWFANVGRIFNPTDAQALALYEAVAGYKPGDPSTDRGTVLRDLLKYVKANRAAGGHRILAYVTVDPRNHAQVKTAIQLFGCLYAGVTLTQDNYRLQGVNWHSTSGAGGKPDPQLGHCVIYTGYDTRRIKQVTWGQEGTITWGCHDRIAEELWAVVSPDWIIAATGKSPTGLDLAALQRDLAAL